VVYFICNYSVAYLVVVSSIDRKIWYISNFYSHIKVFIYVIFQKNQLELGHNGEVKGSISQYIVVINSENHNMGD